MHDLMRCFRYAVLFAGLQFPVHSGAQLWRALPNVTPNISNFTQNRQTGRTCSQLKQWVSSMPAAAGSRRTEDLLPLLDDAHFGRAFNKSYEQLTMADFREFQQGLTECNRTGAFTPGEAQTAQYVLNPSMHPTLVRQLAAARTQRTQQEALLSEFDKLQPTESDVQKLESMERQANASLRSASPEQRQAIASKIAATRQRIAGPVQRERVTKALAEAQGAEGMARLADLHESLGKSGAGAQDAELLRQQVAQRIKELGVPLAEQESTAASAIGNGLPGLEQSARFLATFETRYRRAASFVPELEAVRHDVTDKRATQLAENRPALTAQLQNAKTPAAANDILNRYLTSSERQGSQRDLVSLAQQQSATLQRKSENERVFGATADPTKNATQVATRAPSSRGKQGFLTDPGELRKYNEGRLIKAIFDGDVSALPSDKVFVRAYLLQHARVFADPCRMFTLSEIREFENTAAREQLPRNQAEMGQQLAQSLKAFTAMASNPRGMADAAAAQQKREDAAELADKDLEVLVETYGSCDSAIMKQYAKNVGSYLRNSASR